MNDTSYVTLPLHVQKARCASPDTAEWRLLFNGEIVASTFAPADTRAPDAISKLLAGRGCVGG